MCGIVGFVQRSPAPELLARMLAAVAHRGPDGAGTWHGTLGPWHVALGHRRLSIIDVEGGRQPMGNEDGRVQITYNGELYNFRELRPALEAKGHRFTTRSDTEVIVHQLEDAGEAGLAALSGMFAFGLWDARDGTLRLARDRIGIKPLYYAPLPDGGIAFASELSALLVHPGIERKLSREGLLSYLFSDYAHPPWTLVERVRKLEPAHSVVWRDGEIARPRPYWRLTPGTGETRSNERLAEELWERLERAVRRQMIADVPVGVFLSGGLDSSSAATAARSVTSERLRTFSVGFEAEDFDESPYARLVARRLGTQHDEEVLSERGLLDHFDAAIDSLDEPLADHSYLPTFLLSRFAARHVKVALGGDGGDELWGGYPTYLAHAYGAPYWHVPDAVRRAFVDHVLARLPVTAGYQGLDWKIRRFAGRWDDDTLRRHLRWLSSVDLPDLPLAAPWSRGLVPATLQAEYPRSSERLTTVMAVDLASYLPGSVLTKVDRASMAHGLEVRPPLLDDDFVEWAFSLPAHTKVRRGHGKHLFKLAARRHLPAEIVTRKKSGFAVPVVAWVRGPLRERVDEAIVSGALWDDGVLDRATYARWRDEHVAGSADHGKPLWALLVLARWVRRHRMAG
jgi:asparagine synthase (glutamine-hydrolysing)